MDEKNYYTIKELAKLKRCSTQAMHTWIKRNHVPVKNVGKTLIVEKQNFFLLKFLN